MDCLKVSELLSAYIDGVIDEKDKELVERHLNECDKCRQEFDVLNKIIAGCRNLDEIDLPDNFEEEFHNRLESEKHIKKYGWTSIIYRYRAAAAGFLALVVSVGMLSSLGIFKQGIHKKSESTAQNAAVGRIEAKDKASDATDNTAGLKETESGTADSKKSEDIIVGAKDIPAGNSEVKKNVQNHTLKKAPSSTAPKTARGSDGSKASTSAGANANETVPPLSDNNDKMMSLAAPSGHSYDMININLTGEEYISYAEKIENDLNAMEGKLKTKEPLQYIVPGKYKEKYVNKLKDEYKINDVDVKNINLADKYEKLKKEEADVEKKLKDNTDTASNQQLTDELNRLKTEVKEIDEMTNNIIVQINKK